MKTIALTLLSLAIAASFSSSSFAQSNSNNRNYVSESSRRAVARVTRVERTQRDSHQRQECWNERTNTNDSGYYRDDSGRLYRGDGSNKTARTVIGAIVGGALGTQVGGGDGRTAATIAGAAIGAAVGSNTGGNNRYEGYDRYRDDSGTERHCRNIGNYNSRNPGLYRVSYSYAGITYQTTTNYNPGRTLRVLVDVRPDE